MGDADVPEGVEHHTIGLVDTDVADNPNIAHVLADTARTVADLADAGERVFVHCAHAEHRAPTLAAAYLVVRGADVETAVRRAREALGGAPQPFMRDALAEVERISRRGQRALSRPDVSRLYSSERLRPLPPSSSTCQHAQSWVATCSSSMVT